MWISNFIRLHCIWRHKNFLLHTCIRQSTAFPTILSVHPVKIQISLCVSTVWSEYMICRANCPQSNLLDEPSYLELYLPDNLPITPLTWSYICILTRLYIYIYKTFWSYNYQMPILSTPIVTRYQSYLDLYLPDKPSAVEQYQIPRYPSYLELYLLDIQSYLLLYLPDKPFYLELYLPDTPSYLELYLPAAPLIWRFPSSGAIFTW